jgi:hypothetical protein
MLRSSPLCLALLLVADSSCAVHGAGADVPHGSAARAEQPAASEPPPASAPDPGAAVDEIGAEAVFLGRRTPASSPIAKPAPASLYGLSWDQDVDGECEEDLGPALDLWERAEPDVALFATPRIVEELGITAPTEPIWLIGPDAPCRAAIGRPMLGFHPSADRKEKGPPKATSDGNVIEVSWELTGCTVVDPDRWAPLGLRGPIDPDLRWHEAAPPSPPEPFDPAGWEGPLRDEVGVLADEAAKHSTSALTWWRQRVRVPGTDIEALVVSAVRPRPQAEGTAARPQTCEDRQAGGVFTLRAGRVLDPPRDALGRLVGVLAVGGAARLVVYDGGGELQIAALHPESEGITAFEEIDTGAYDPEDLELPTDSVLDPCGP